jgi:hypothetical protein
MQPVLKLKVFKTLKSLLHYWRTTYFDRHWSSSGVSKIVVEIAALRPQVRFEYILVCAVMCCGASVTLWWWIIPPVVSCAFINTFKVLIQVTCETAYNTGIQYNTD